MPPPRTIDNLGLDVSTRYAEDQQKLDQKLIKESKAIPSQTEIDVTSPAFASEFDLLFDTAKRNLPWAEFSVPEKYNEQKKRLFTFQLIPSLGTQDKKEGQAQKILAKFQGTTQHREKEEKEEKDQKGSKKRKWEEEKEKHEEDKEKKILMNLLNCILTLDKTMMDINSRRTQYQKG
jgi:hypothetical protein